MKTKKKKKQNFRPELQRKKNPPVKGMKRAFMSPSDFLPEGQVSDSLFFPERSTRDLQKLELCDCRDTARPKEEMLF